MTPLFPQGHPAYPTPLAQIALIPTQDPDRDSLPCSPDFPPSQWSKKGPPTLCTTPLTDPVLSLGTPCLSFSSGIRCLSFLGGLH